ncbi:hypothetical protein ASG87_16055 [Frateuria sp. Soil773]|nr:hypothetical protein ASG87_16055 [Frateuria sp. Soil773]
MRCVLFDLDGVLVDYDRDVRVGTLARLTGRTSAAVRAAIYASGIEEDADAGVLDAQAYLDALGRELDTVVVAADWTAARRAATRARSEVLALAASLADRAAPGLLTNNGWLMAQQLPAIVPELFPLFAGRAFCAAQFGAAKPAEQAYLRCLQALDALPQATLFVDDNPANVEGARAAGLHAHRFTDAAGLRQALAGFGLS